MPSTPPGAAPAAVATRRPDRRRIRALDVLRGFALCGVLVANVKPIAHRGSAVLGPADRADGSLLDRWLHLLVDQRFFPIFSLLFGIGFSLLAQSAAARGARPRVVLARRLVALLAVGLAHHVLLWRGDILAVYAVVGLVVLLPSTWLPRWAVAAAAGALVAVSLALGLGGFMLVPGLFLLGSALTRYGVVARIDRSLRVPAGLALAFAAAAAPLLWLQARSESTDPDGWTFRFAYPAAGLLLAGLYVCGLLVLQRTPLRRSLEAVFAPLGRMALTNYLSATVAVLAVSSVVPGSDGWGPEHVLPIAAGILLVQWAWSTLWLRHHLQGPLEWLWRWVTWGRRPALRRHPHRAGAERALAR